jgi:hypothetical protein
MHSSFNILWALYLDMNSYDLNFIDCAVLTDNHIIIINHTVDLSPKNCDATSGNDFVKAD